MGDLETWSGRGLSPYTGSRQSLAARRSARVIVEKARLDALDVEADAALTARAMELVVDLDGIRQQLATNNETNRLLFELEMGFAQRTGRKIANRHSPLGGL